MSNPRDKYQHYVCPQDFQDRINEVGGFNRYDEPNFIVIWSQGGDERALYRAGGDWSIPGMPSYRGYRDLLVGGGTPSWALCQWHDAIEYGTPELYYVQNYDEETGLQTIGEYPYKGRYQLLYNLRWTERTSEGLKFEAMPLNSFLLDLVLPIIVASKDISWEKTKAALLDLKEKEDAADVAMIEDVMRASALPFKGAPVSYGKQGCRTSLVDQKIYQMQKYWNQMMTRANRLGRGLSVHSQDEAQSLK